MTERALVTGITGQDGHYLTELLLSKGYEVFGYARRGAKVPNGAHAFIGDLTDAASLKMALTESAPDEIYNLGAQSHVRASFEDPDYTFRVTALPVITILEWMREKAVGKDVRLYQASTSELFGSTPPPQDENTVMRPRSPYAIAKHAAHHSVRLWREAYGVYGACGILFNHESPIRPTTFVTRKITHAVANIFLGKQRELVLGNLDAYRDWGHAKDYVRAMHLMLQQPEPKDYVIATGETHTVREFLEEAWAAAQRYTGQEIPMAECVKLSSAFHRPAEVDALRGDFSRAHSELGWSPAVKFAQLVDEMVLNDLAQSGMIAKMVRPRREEPTAVED